MSSDHDVAAGLFDWINSLEVADEVAIADDLKDGLVVWKVLQQIDRFSFPGDLPEHVETEQWVHRWTDLKHIYDALSIFLLEECGQNMPLRASRPDLKAIAQSASLVDTILLLKLVVVAAINCADRIKYLENMQTLAVSTQEVLMTTAQEADEDDEARQEDEDEDEDEDELPDAIDSPRSIGPDIIDSDLASEERLGKVIADNQRIAHEKRDLQNQVHDLQDRLAKLQAVHDGSLEELKDTNERLTAVLAGTTDSGRNKMGADAKQETVIAALEAEVAEVQEDSNQLRKSNELLRIKAERVQKLQDDYDEMKIERDRLSRRANAAEKYKQKLEAMQEVEKENSGLRAKIVELQTQLKQSDSSQVTSSDLLREVDEYRRLLPSIEQERHELNEMKKRLEFDYHILEARHQDTLDQFSRQQHTLEELQGRLRDYDDGLTPATPKANGTDADGETLEGTFAENEAKLTEALLAEQAENENSITEEELRVIMLAMKAQAEAESGSEKALSKQVEKKLLNAIQRSYEQKRQLQEHIQKQSALILDLQSKESSEPHEQPSKEMSLPPAPAPAPAPTTPPPSTPSTSAEAKLRETLVLNENLRRELRLMTSAWHEQHMRWMSNSAHPTRARATADPRSFLGKQRKVAEKAMLGSSGA